MLQKKTIDPGTLELLKSLMLEPIISKFALAGGTALSLRYGHRKSVDLDFFTNEPFDSNKLFEALKAQGYNFGNEILEIGNNTLNAEISNIKVQFLGHLYNQVNPYKVIEDIRMYDCPDIAAMKLNAIANRGAKKDFWDIDLLLGSYNLQDMLRFYEQKYNQKNIQHVIKSLTYFDDADKEKDPICLRDRKWSDVKKRVSAAVKLFVDQGINQKLNKNKFIIPNVAEKKSSKGLSM